MHDAICVKTEKCCEAHLTHDANLTFYKHILINGDEHLTYVAEYFRHMFMKDL